MAEILHLLRYKVLSFLKINIDLSFENVLKNLGSFLVYTGFAVATFLVTRAVLSFLVEEIHIGLFLIHRFISMLLYVFFLTINVGNIIVAYATMFKSKEISYLLTTPVSHTSVFVTKFLDNFFYSSTTLSMIGFAVLLGYGTYFGQPWTFYVWVIGLVVFPFLLLAAILGVVLLMGLISIAARIGSRLVIAMVSVGYLASVYGFFKLSNPVQLVHQVMKYYPTIDQYFGFLDPPFLRYLPNHWVAETLYWTSVGNVGAAVPFVASLSILCLLVMAAGLLVGRSYYFKSWLSSLDLKTQRIVRQNHGGWLRLGNGSGTEPQTAALLKKELWQFLREPSQWIHMTVILFLMTIFVASIIRIDLPFTLPVLHTVAYLVIFIFNAFLIASIALRFVYPMVSIEGEAFWKVRSAPIGIPKVAGVKFAAAFGIVLCVSLLLNGFAHLQPNLASPLMLASSASVVFISLGMTALCFGMGCLFATFKEKNPIRVASSQGASLTFLVSLLYLVFLVAVLFVPMNTYFEHFMRGRILTPGLPTAVSAIGAVSIVLAVLSYFVGLKSLHRDY